LTSAHAAKVVDFSNICVLFYKEAQRSFVLYCLIVQFEETQEYFLVAACARKSLNFAVSVHLTAKTAEDQRP